MTMRTSLLLLLALTACRQDPPKDLDTGKVTTVTNPDGDVDGDGYKVADGDCNDNDALVHPGAEETPYNGIDDDCDPGSPDDDLDGDGYLEAVDCDDGDFTVNPGAEDTCDGVDNDCDGTADNSPDNPTWYADTDGDGYGDDAVAVDACDQPEGHVAAGGDCDDGDAAYNPGATEDDCTDPADYNCDGSTGYDDLDGDGFPACEDCDDGEDDTFPGATEVCNLLDDDCDGTADEDAVDGATWYADADGDGYGDEGTAVTACEAPEGHVSEGGDCDDADPAVNPGAVEDCADPTDLNCDGSVGYADADGDGWAACEECDDGAAGVNPGATEVCDGVDNDCSGATDDGATDASTWYTDGDSDGYGGADTVVACDQPVGTTAASEDCDDDDRRVNPSATEVCDGVDNDCDGTTDGPDASGAGDWYADADGDGFGDAAAGLTDCEAPAGYVADDADCDDGDAGVNPDADEVCDAVDNDCDGAADEGAVDAVVYYTDADGDGYGGTAGSACEAPEGSVTTGGDCDDGDSGVNPGAAEVCDYVDNDCASGVDDGYRTGSKYTLDTDCGSCGNDCGSYEFDNASGYCDTAPSTPSCTYTCDAGFYDVNGSALDGCECAWISATDDPFDGVDADCDGSDGTPPDAIYVSPSGSPTGDGSAGDPVDTVQDGIDLAVSSGIAEVYVAEGTYTENIELADGVSVWGGFDAGFTLRDPVAYVSTLDGEGSTSVSPATVIARDIVTSTTFAGFTVVGNTRPGPGSSAIGVWIEDCSDALEIRDNLIDAQSARDGVDGTGGADGSDGSAGSDGAAGTTTSCATLPDGGAGGANTCDGTSTAGGDGGGAVCPEFGVDQEVGADGLPAGGAGGATGCDGIISASACGTCNIDTCWDEGSDGAVGADGADGSGGSGASDADGAPTLGLWSAAGGADGGDGAYGNGGGGGGAGSGAEVDGACGSAHLGGTGGGGGAGGCAGLGGAGGDGGGGSVGIVLVYSASTTLPVIEGNTISAGNGGYGGDGGDGGVGGSGGLGGTGGARETTAAWCGQAGGNGGEGGAGGAGGGGGGGAGGVSLAVAAFGVTPDAAYVSAGNSLGYGSAGAGGRGGLAGSTFGVDGTDGVDGEEGEQNW